MHYLTTFTPNLMAFRSAVTEVGWLVGAEGPFSVQIWLYQRRQQLWKNLYTNKGGVDHL